MLRTRLNNAESVLPDHPFIFIVSFLRPMAYDRCCSGRIRTRRPLVIGVAGRKYSNT